MAKASALDQYYTRSDLADAYVQQALDRYGPDRTYLEPSAGTGAFLNKLEGCLLYTSPSPRDRTRSRMPSSA